MARRPLGCLVAALAVCAWVACGKDKNAGKANTPDLDKRCEQLAKTCGDSEKHIGKIVESCRQAAKKQTDKGCADKASALYDCYEKELCGKDDKVWTVDDFRVLSERHKKCEAEQAAARTCVGE